MPNYGHSFSNDNRASLVQGTIVEETDHRRMQGSVLAATERLPMWGGVAVSVVIGSDGMGPYVPQATRATSADKIGGFSLFPPSVGGRNGPPRGYVPQSNHGQQVNFCPIGSNVEVVVALDPDTAEVLSKMPLPTSVLMSWDCTNQRLLLGYLPLKAAPVRSVRRIVTTGATVVVCDQVTGAPSWADRPVAVILI
jgi:hypothetical protein